MTLVAKFQPRAVYDIDSIATYISVVLDAPQAANEWRIEFLKTVELLCSQPEIGRPFQDERLRNKTYRTFLVGNYRLFYSYDETTLNIWRVIHTSRNMDDYALVAL